MSNCVPGVQQGYRETEGRGRKLLAFFQFPYFLWMNAAGHPYDYIDTPLPSMNKNVIIVSLDQEGNGKTSLYFSKWELRWWIFADIALVAPRHLGNEEHRGPSKACGGQRFPRLPDFCRVQDIPRCWFWSGQKRWPKERNRYTGQSISIVHCPPD